MLQLPYLIALLSLLLTLAPSRINAEETKYLGVATCASSSCHGATSPRKTTNVLQNEFSTWHRHGQHSKAWKVLLEDDAQKIAKHLDIQHPEREPLCLECHTTYVPQGMHGEKFTYEDGVGCESCHGAASKWIRSHVEAGTTHAENVNQGLKDLTDLKARSQLCLSCHYGTEDKIVNHRLIGAGHPRLTFELDTFSMIQPQHWELDEDYKERKGDYVAAKAWLIGQTILGSEQLKALSSPIRSKNGIWPELSLFTCESCHHSLKEDRWKFRDFGQRAGELRLNVSSLTLISTVLRVIDQDAATHVDALLETLHEEYKAGSGENTLKQLQTLMIERVLKKVNAIEYNDELLEKLFREVTHFSTRPHFQYEEAEQILMGLSSLVASSKRLERQYGESLEDLYTALQDDEAHNAEAFTKAASKLYRELSD